MLCAQGLAPRTVQRHVGNAWEYVDWLRGRRLRDEPVRAADGASRIDAYFSYGFAHDEYATPGTVGESVGSIKKLYRFMADTGRIPEGEYECLLSEIRAFKPDCSTSLSATRTGTRTRTGSMSGSEWAGDTTDLGRFRKEASRHRQKSNARETPRSDG